MADTKNLTISINADSSDFKKGLELAKLETNKLQKNFTRLGKASSLAFAGISAALTGTVLAFRGFERDFTQVVTLLDKTSFASKDLKSGIDGLKKGVLDLRSASGESFEALNKGLFDLISAGIPAEQAINSLKIATDLAAAGGTDVAIAVDAITTSINAFGLETSDGTEIAQKFFLAQKNGKTTVAELSNSLGVAASNAESFGVSLDEVLAATSAATLAGKSTSQALTGLNQVFANIAKPTADAAKEAERLGIQFDSAALRSKGLEGFLNDLVTAEGFTSSSIEKLFGSVEAMGVAFALTGEQNKDFVSTLKQLQNEAQLTDTFNEALAASNETVDKALKKLGGSLQAVLATLGAKFAPLIIKVADGLGSFARMIQNASDRTLNIIKNIVVFTAAITGLTAVISTAGLGIIVFRNILKGLAAQFAFAGTAARLFWLAVSGPIGKIISLVAGVTAGFIALKKVFASSPEKDLNKITKELEELENKEKSLQAIIQTGSEKQADRARKRLEELSKEKAQLEDIRNELTASIGADEVGALLEERKVKIKELQEEQGKLAEQVLSNDAKVSEKSAERLLAIDEEIAKLKELNEVSSQGSMTEESGGGDILPEEAPEAETNIDSLREQSEERISVVAQETDLKIAEARREAEVLAEIRKGASEQEISSIREKNALIAEEEKIKLDNELLNAELRTAGITEQRQIEIDKQLALNEIELQNIQAHRELLNEQAEEDRQADLEADELIRQIQRDQNIEFNEEELALLKAQIRGKKQINNKFLLDSLSQQQKADARFLDMQRKFGKTAAKLDKATSSEQLANVRSTTGKLAALKNSENSKLKAIGKAAAIANIAIDTAKGAVAAYTALAGIPIVGPGLGAAAAAALIAYGAEQTAAATKANTGAFVSRGIRGVDDQPFLLSRGESVIPADITPELFNTFKQLRDIRENGGLIGTLAKEAAFESPTETTSIINEERVEQFPIRPDQDQEETEAQTINVAIEIEENATDFITAQQRENQELGIGII